MFSTPRWLLPPIFLLLLAGCDSAGAVPSATPSPTLIPYRSATPNPTPTAVPLASDPGDELRPTATPFVHAVAEGETLLDIALQYGVSLGDMQAANPDIDPRFLSIGQELRIPGPEGQSSPSLLPTSTPLPLQLGRGACYPSVTEALWCLATVTNDTGSPVEGITARLHLLDQQGDSLARQLAFTPLNRLRAGQRMPVVAYFAPPAPEPAEARFELISAVDSTDGQERYVAVELADQEAAPRATANAWDVSATLKLAEPEGRASLAALGIGADGEVVGYVKWTAPEGEGGPFEIELTVSSFGPPIESVEVLAEAVRTAEDL